MFLFSICLRLISCHASNAVFKGISPVFIHLTSAPKGDPLHVLDVMGQVGTEGMRKKKYTAEQIVTKLREVDVLLKRLHGPILSSVVEQLTLG